MKTKYIILAIISFLVITSCSSDKKKNEKLTYSQTISEIVNKVPNGSIRSKDNIKVWFNNDVVDSTQLNKELKDEVFSFDPSIDGKTYWQRTDVLVFKPEEPLKYREEYSGTLNMQKLSEEFREKGIEDLKFRFKVMGPEINSFQANITLKNQNNPNIVNYSGRIFFSEKIDLEKLKEAISLKDNNKDYSIEVFAEPNFTSFKFISEDIVRDKSRKQFKFKIDKDPLDLSRDIVREFEVTSLEELKVTKVKKLEDEAKPKIRIEFSDELDFQQNLNGMITVKELLDVKVQKMNNALILDGNFNFGEEYHITIDPGLRSRWGTKLIGKFVATVKFKDMKPSIEFVSDGIILPTTNQYKLQFYTSNLKRVHLEIKRVYAKSLSEFLSTERISSNSDRKQSFRAKYINRVGVIVYNETMEISSEKNKLLLSELDLTNVVKNNKKGIYLIRLNFNPRDMLVQVDEETDRYIEEEGQIYKPLLFSNIGLTSKQAGNKYIVYATDIVTGKPLSGVNVKLRRMYSSDIVSSAVTNADGIVTLSKEDRYYGNFYIVAEKDGQRSIIKFGEMAWNISGFDIGGIDQVRTGIRAFIYTERGVYRPGDEINLSFIARNIKKDFPDNHPVTLSLFNPQRKKVYEITNKVNKEGFYNFNIKTKETDQTGNWTARFNIGNEEFSHTIKIETVVPYRLKVKINPEHKTLMWNNEILKFNVQCNYLFGNPGADLPLNVDLEIIQMTKKFGQYKNFVFSNPVFDFKKIQKNIFKGKLDKKGFKDISWDLPSFNNIPSALDIKITATVTEKGGRPNKNWIYVPLEPYPHYVGIQAPKYSYIETGSDLNIPVILVDTKGKPIAGKILKYRIYKNSKYWWWYYGKQRKLKFKSDNSTVLVEEGEIITKKTHDNIKFVPIDKGSYLVEVIDETGGHSSGIFLSAYPYGGSPGGDKNAGTLALSSDKGKYFVGDNAMISFPAPKEGSVLFTVERWNKILEQRWYYPDGNEKMVIKVPITKEMVPNSYVTVSLIQPHSQTVNDRPIRTFGILPLTVEDKETKHFIDIKTSSQFRPKEEFIIDLQTSDYKQTQFTIAVVDEGLLDITRFKTPNPWKYFFQKIRLAVRTYDLFSQVIAANIGDVFKTFLIGGDMDYRESQLQPEKGKKRFKPVSLFKGPIMTDRSGKARVKFKMPNYIGSVRIMVIGARKNSYATAEKTVPVKTELMVLPTLPRVIGPNEKFTIPTTVFAMKDNIGKVKVEIFTEGPIKINGSKNKTLMFSKAADKDCYFDVTTLPEVGQAKVMIKVKSDKYSANYNVDIMVRPSSARIYKKKDYKIAAGDNLEIEIPAVGLKGTNRATLTLSSFPNINFGHRLKWLIHYPYGCIEQTTSSVFPQLFLKRFIKYPEAYSERIDRNINIALEKLRKFQTLSGGFSYWPYSVNISPWGNLYGGHFMIEARKLGYHTAEDLYLNWLNYTKRNAKRHEGGLMTRVYRVYILAIDGNAELSEMNTLKESQFDKMTNPQKWLLAATYKLAGLSTDAEMMTSNLETTIKDYQEFSGTYGSALRDKAMMLEAMVILGKYDFADKLTKEISSVIVTEQWLSTQTLGYSLLAIGKYMDAVLGKNQNLVIKGYTENSKGKKVPFDNKKSFEINITEGFGEPLNIVVDKGTTTENVYVTLAYDGVPLKSNVITENKNIKLSVSWVDEDGNEINPTSIKQGTTFYGKFNVKNISSLEHIDEVALVQILPSGWEIVNTRLLDESLPLWTSKLRINREEYSDIRDDRIMWFFDLNDYWIKNKRYKGKLDFVVKLTAVTVGEFMLPATIAECMYNNNYKASKAAKKIKVIKP